MLLTESQNKQHSYYVMFMEHLEKLLHGEVGGACGCMNWGLSTAVRGALGQNPDISGSQLPHNKT